MDKLKNILNQYAHWSLLTVYTERIEAFLVTDFSVALENAKALLETIGKEICASKGAELGSKPSINWVLKKAFSSIGYSGESMVAQISTSLANIGQQVGDLRNEIGISSHGRPLEEISGRNNKIDELSKELLIDTTVLVACFLIRSYENENPSLVLPEVIELSYEDNEDFNNYWDEIYDEFIMGDYSYLASEILYNLDYSAYMTERKVFIESTEIDELTE